MGMVARVKVEVEVVLCSGDWENAITSCSQREALSWAEKVTVF